MRKPLRLKSERGRALLMLRADVLRTDRHRLEARDMPVTTLGIGLLRSGRKTKCCEIALNMPPVAAQVPACPAYSARPAMVSKNACCLYIHLQRAITLPDKFSMPEGKQEIGRLQSGIRMRGDARRCRVVCAYPATTRRAAGTPASVLQ